MNKHERWDEIIKILQNQNIQFSPFDPDQCGFHWRSTKAPEFSEELRDVLRDVQPSNGNCYAYLTYDWVLELYFDSPEQTPVDLGLTCDPNGVLDQIQETTRAIETQNKHLIAMRKCLVVEDIASYAVGVG